MAESHSQEVLYQRRVPVFPRSVQGRFRRFKFAVLILAYGVYFILPWLRWERANAPNQAVLFDIAGRHYFVFDLAVSPQDMFWLAGILVIAAMLLFLVTGIAGRVFCGFFCFQTLWTDVFMLIERLVQGERPARMRLAAAPWTADKWRKMLSTWGLWLLTAFWTGFTFTLYWANAPELLVDFFTGQAPFAAYATTAFLTATTFVFAGLAREQVCTYMCPYARFQSAMFDRDTLIIAYDQQRGEGSGGRARLSRGRKQRDERRQAGAGDCIDCGFCVQVCPTGIDIRNGLQLQCISCGLCVDACDTIMDKLNWPRGLISYTSERALEGGRTRILKPKTLLYGAVLMVAIPLLAWSVASADRYTLSVSQIRQPLAVTLSDGSIQNRYELKVNNLDQQPQEFVIRIAGLSGAELDLGGFRQVRIDAGRGLRLLAKVRLPGDVEAPGQSHFSFEMEVPGEGGTVISRPATFYLPGR